MPLAYGSRTGRLLTAFCRDEGDENEFARPQDHRLRPYVLTNVLTLPMVLPRQYHGYLHLTCDPACAKRACLNENTEFV